MKAWIYQDDKQVKKHGTDAASWYVGWVDPEGKRRCESCGPGSAGMKAATKLKDKRQAELITGTYRCNSKKTWAEFRQEYEERIGSGMPGPSWQVVREALEHFKRLIKPVRLAALKTQTIDDFIVLRRKERGRKKGDLLSPASVNKELRHLKAALRIANEWGYLPTVPKFRMVKEPGKLPTYVTPEHFAALYKACDMARLPNDQPYSAADWWRGLLIMGYMTGWRISELLSLRREDLDLETGTAVTRFEDNKGNRDDMVKLHPVAVEHLKKLACFDPGMLPWNCHRRTLDTEFLRIQQHAGIKLPCRRTHEHTDACYSYGFHDLRRAFATMNADRLTGDALQALMRHKSYQTTQRYIRVARQLDQAVAGLYVPELGKAASV